MQLRLNVVIYLRFKSSDQTAQGVRTTQCLVVDKAQQVVTLTGWTSLTFLLPISMASGTARKEGTPLWTGLFSYMNF